MDLCVSLITAAPLVDLNLTFILIFKATAVYQAKEKLKSVDKARKGEQIHLSSIQSTPVC